MRLILSGSGAEIESELRKRYQHTPPLPNVQMQLLPYQMVGLYAATWEQCSRQQTGAGGRILEIGTGFGASAYMMSKAGPRVEIMSLTVNEKEAAIARKFLAHNGCTTVEIVVQASWDYMAAHPESEWDMIFVDGDHNRIARDLAWFNRLRVGGLFLCHDYSPAACPPVYGWLNRLGEQLEREPDVLLMDTDRIGMAGFYRREGEAWQD